MADRRGYRCDHPLELDTVPRPQFDKMIADLERARSMWDIPNLRVYSRALLRLAGSMALEESAVEPLYAKVLAVFKRLMAQVDDVALRNGVLRDRARLDEAHEEALAE
jgi:hypothetical protein